MAWFSQTYHAGRYSSTWSHRLKVMHSLDLGVWLNCLSRFPWHAGVIFTDRSCRRLSGNQITSITSSTFTGIGSLDALYTTIAFTLWRDFSLCARSGIWPTTVSHRLLVALLLDLQAWVYCMLRSCHITTSFFKDWSCRYLFNNQITSIASGAFTGLGSLTSLYVILPSSYQRLFIIVLVQGPIQQSDHIDFEWRIHWTYKPYLFVSYSASLRHQYESNVMLV